MHTLKFVSNCNGLLHLSCPPFPFLHSSLWKQVLCLCIERKVFFFKYHFETLSGSVFEVCHIWKLFRIFRISVPCIFFLLHPIWVKIFTFCSILKEIILSLIQELCSRLFFIPHHNSLPTHSERKSKIPDVFPATSGSLAQASETVFAALKSCLGFVI